MSRIKYKISENILNIHNEKDIPVVFPYPIVQVLSFSDMLIVRIEPTVQSCFNENVYGVSFTGKILWQVDKTKHIYDDSPYTGIKLSKDEEDYITLYNWDGLDLKINRLTGKMISTTYKK